MTWFSIRILLAIFPWTLLSYATASEASDAHSCTLKSLKYVSLPHNSSSKVFPRLHNFYLDYLREGRRFSQRRAWYEKNNGLSYLLTADGGMDKEELEKLRMRILDLPVLLQVLESRFSGSDGPSEKFFQKVEDFAEVEYYPGAPKYPPTVLARLGNGKYALLSEFEDETVRIAKLDSMCELDLAFEEPIFFVSSKFATEQITPWLHDSEISFHLNSEICRNYPELFRIAASLPKLREGRLGILCESRGGVWSVDVHGLKTACYCRGPLRDEFHEIPLSRSSKAARPSCASGSSVKITAIDKAEDLMGKGMEGKFENYFEQLVEEQSALRKSCEAFREDLLR